MTEKPTFRYEPSVIIQVMNETFREYGQYLTNNQKKLKSFKSNFKDPGAGAGKVLADVRKRLKEIKGKKK